MINWSQIANFFQINHFFEIPSGLYNWPTTENPEISSFTNVMSVPAMPFKSKHKSGFLGFSKKICQIHQNTINYNYEKPSCSSEIPLIWKCGSSYALEYLWETIFYFENSIRKTILSCFFKGSLRLIIWI